MKNTVMIQWAAEEYIQRNKNVGWYVGLIAVGLIFIALSIFLQAWTFTALIIVAIIALIIYTVRPPRIIEYSLQEDGLHEGERLYRYENFKAFGLLKENDHYAIVLMPRKRFSPRVTVYFPQEQGEKIVDVFGNKLPMEEAKLDFLDKIVRWLRI